jgi:hypothetical protein
MDQGSARRAKAHREFHGHKHNVIVSLETPRVNLSRPSEEGHVSHDRPYWRSETQTSGLAGLETPKRSEPSIWKDAWQRIQHCREGGQRHHKPRSSDGVRLWSRYDGHVDQGSARRG